ncbi:hypothetical protein ACEPAG_6947 [Sanghuangporus baumii]
MSVATFTAPVDTCKKVQCSKCGKTTWAGCGMHVDSVMADVAPENKCECPRE